jgi:hypothetical protein
MGNIFFSQNNKVNKNEDIFLLESKNRCPIVKFNSYYLHSKYDPIKEAKRLANYHYKKNYLHVLFGFGFSHIAKEVLAKLGENDFLLIIEPSMKLFEIVRNQGLLSPFSEHENASFIVGFDEIVIDRHLRTLINGTFFAQVELIVSPNYEKLYFDYTQKLKEIISNNVHLSLVNISTLTYFSENWQKNLLYNLVESWKSMPLRAFIDKFTCPAIIASSGPSLTKQLKNLKMVAEKHSALIIAAGSTINPLLNADIKPHFVVTIDGGEANWQHFRDINYDDIPLFYSLNVHKEIPKKHTGYKVVFNSDDKTFAEWIDEVSDQELGFVKGGPSVANYCFYIAKMITTGPITFIGQDLAYTNNVSHAAGNKNYIGLTNQELNDTKKIVMIEGFYGEKVVSSYPFLGMKKSMEEMVEYFRKNGDKRTFFNSTEGGAIINGLENLDFKTFIKQYCHNSYWEQFVEAFKPYEKDFKRKDQILGVIEEERRHLQEAKLIVGKAIDILKGISKATEQIDARVLGKLDKVDEKLNELLKSNIVHHIVRPVVFRINYLYQEKEHETPHEQKKRILEKSEALYKGIDEILKTTITILDNILPR